MNKSRNSQISDSEESEDNAERREPTPKKVSFNNNDVSSSDFSSEEEERTRRPTPPVEVQTKKHSLSSPKKATFNPLKRFVSQNEDLTKVVVNDVICEDDDVCILELPKTMDPNLFLEKLVNFDRKTKIKLNHTKYIIEPEIDVKPVNLLTQKLKIVHPISILTLREYKKNKHEGEAVETPNSLPAMPGNLKVRHPLFGAEYKRKIVLNEEIQRKLDHTLYKAVKKMKKKQQKTEETKKKQKKKRSVVAEEDPSRGNMEESIFSLLETHIAGKKKNPKEGEILDFNLVFGEDVPKKKRKNSLKQESFTSPSEFVEKKKRKNSTMEGTQEPLEVEKTNSFSNQNKSASSALGTPAGKKNKNHDEWETSDFNISENVPKKKHKNSIKEENCTESEFESTKRKRKNSAKEDNSSEMEKTRKTSFHDQNKSESSSGEKKRKHKIKEEIFSQDEAEVSPQQDTRKRKNSTKTEENRRRSSIINSTIIPDLQLPFFEFDVSSIGNKGEAGGRTDSMEIVSIAKSPKKKIEELNVSHNGSGSKRKVRDDSEEDSSPPKKKKKVKEEPQDEATSSLILNLLNKVKTEIGTTPKPKKKRKSEN